MIKTRLFLGCLTIICALEYATGANMDCHGKTCHEFIEYCSTYLEGCDKCENICNFESHNYAAQICIKECPAYHQYSPLQKEILNIQTQQAITLVLLTILLLLVCAHFAYKLIFCLRKSAGLQNILRKLHLRKNCSSNGKNKSAETNQNIITISDVERTLAPPTEASMATLTTPISRRYPAENSSSPVSITDFSYENQALSVTPVFDKSNGGNIAKESL